MLEEYTVIGGSKKIFDQYSKELNVNMTKMVRTLHRKNSNCPYSKNLSNFIPFNTLEEVSEFEKAHIVQFGRCANCFKQGIK